MQGASLGGAVFHLAVRVRTMSTVHPKCPAPSLRYRSHIRRRYRVAFLGIGATAVCDGVYRPDSPATWAPARGIDLLRQSEGQP
jgi:hypothetical protein